MQLYRTLARNLLLQVAVLIPVIGMNNKMLRLLKVLAFTAVVLVLSGRSRLVAETLDDAPSITGTSDYSVSNGKLIDLAFNMDGHAFTLAGATGDTLVRFLDGQRNDITFSQMVGMLPNRFTLHSSSGYAFYYNDGQAASYGTFAATPAQGPSPVLEAGFLALLATGLLGSSGILHRRLRFAQSN